MLILYSWIQWKKLLKSYVFPVLTIKKIANKSNQALFPETNFHIQKYDGLENIEKPSCALEVTLGSSADANLV